MGVTGPIADEDLGRVLMHEHVRMAYPGDELDPTSTWTRASAIETAVERLHDLQEHGVRTLVDATTFEIGRDPLLLKDVSERSGMQIVCSTGFYYEKIGIPYYWRARSVTEIAELYIHEIGVGILDSGVRAGVIKIASSDPPGKYDRKMIEAAGIAMRETGVGAVTHCEGSNGWEVQLEILERAGADLSRVMIGHQNQQTSFDALRSIARSGASIGMDRIGYSMLAPDSMCVDMILKLIDEGFEDRLCISMDHSDSLRSSRFPFHVPDESRDAIYQSIWPAVRNEYVRPRTYLFQEFIPLLVTAGLREKTIDRMLVENARRILAG
ncbi:MAG: phosphotriesterase family protein [Actinomycetota bacterium]